MPKKFKIYAIEIDDEIYIGCTNDIKRRIKEHRMRCFNEKSKHYTSKFFTYIRSKYNKEEAYEKINKGHKIICEVDTKEEARELEQEYIHMIATLNGRSEINNISNTDRCKLYRQNNLEERRNVEAAYRNSKKGKELRRLWREKNKERQKEKVTCEKCGHISTRKHISDHRRNGLCV